MFLFLFILFDLLYLGCPFCRLQGCSSSYLWVLPPVGGDGQVPMKVPGLEGLLPVFCWVELDLVSLKGSAEHSVVVGCLWPRYGFGQSVC